jgi:uncharacterized protein YyaL (SSP411 family)
MHTNALLREKSPYLRQHAHNPVDWLPWGEAAFEKARAQNKPIFLSIGYSTCHWCHVMAHESFEDPEIAQILNRYFVPVKVDREERPDVDRVYMLFVQAATGSGGWPMSVWLTPDLQPFFGGTYFPPVSRYGRPGFKEILQHVARAWETERERVLASGANVQEQLKAIAAGSGGPCVLDEELFESAFWQLRRSYDPRWGGFGSAPKFPRPVVFNYLLRYYARTRSEEALEMTVKTLAAMSAGGVHDHLGGGFHRYSVDERWFVPHFEKMLYDQAQLIVACAEAYRLTRDERMAETARLAVAYILRDLADPGGGFYSAEDADSPDPENPSHPREGAFYVWRKSEIDGVLGDSAALFCDRYGVEDQGNVENDPQGEFTGRNILYHAMSEADAAARAGISAEAAHELLANARVQLFEIRCQRPRPHLDRKILTGWNGLTISALARASWLSGDGTYLQAAERAASFVLEQLYSGDRSHELLRRYCEGEAAVPAFVDDYALLAAGLLDLFEAGFKPQYLRWAFELASRMLELFEDRENGGFFSTRAGAKDLFLRMKDDYDGAEPSGNSAATDLLLRLAQISGDEKFRIAAERSLQAFAPKIKSQPVIAPQMLVALGRLLAEPEQIVVRCRDYDSQAQAIVRQERENAGLDTLILALNDDTCRQLSDLAPFLAGLERKGRITVYRCRHFSCELPKVID